MQRIKVEQGAPGMVIAHPIETSTGQVLCAKGTELTEGLISRLENLEISHILVEGHPVDDGKPQKTLEEELATLERRFQTVRDNKLMGALKMVVQKHIRKKHQRKQEEEKNEGMAHQEEAGAGSEAAPIP